MGIVALWSYSTIDHYAYLYYFAAVGDSVHDCDRSGYGDHGLSLRCLVFLS